MRIWRVERSASDIVESMDAYSSSKLAAHPDLVACWSFDEGEGRVVHDTSGHGNDLVLTHEPHWCALGAALQPQSTCSRRGPSPLLAHLLCSFGRVISTIAEKKADRDARRAPHIAPDGGAPSATRKKGRAGRVLLVLFFLIAGLLAAVAAFIQREAVGQTLGALAYALVAGVRHVLSRARQLLGRRASSASAGASYRAMEFSDVDAMEAEPLTAYRPPPDLGEM
jgi:hypothetical protein